MSTQNKACRRSDQTGPSPSSAFAGQTQRGGESAAITEVYRGREGFEENSREARRARKGRKYEVSNLFLFCFASLACSARDLCLRSLGSQWESRGTSAPLPPTRMSRSQP